MHFLWSRQTPDPLLVHGHILHPKHVHVQQRVSCDRIGMHEQRRQVRVVQPRVLLEQRRVPSLDHVLEFSVRIYVSDYQAQPRLFDESLHVLRRNGRHR